VNCFQFIAFTDCVSAAPVVAASSKPPTGKSQASTKTEVDNNVPRLFRKSHSIALDLLMDRLDG
jgi:hypothetical protein